VDEINNKYMPDDIEIDDFYAGESSHAWNVFGCRFFAGDGDGAADAGVWRFCLWAPNAKSVSVVGDWNGWDPEKDPMERHRGLWVAFIAEAKLCDNYKYRIECADGTTAHKADPFATHAETPPYTASKIWDTGGYDWGDGAWLSRRENADILHEPVSIYELHVGSWRLKEGYDYPSIRELAGELCSYVLEMGYTHVELMPISEFPFDGSWGYQVTGFFAVTSRFGTPQDYMYFVDTLHQAGIGVIVDWVPAHFPKDAHGLARFDGTWLYEHEHPMRREHPEWGTYEFNYCRPEVVSFLVSSAVNLIEVYHIDGIRVDAVSSMLYLNYGRDHGFIPNRDGGNIDYEAADFLKKFNAAVLGGHPGTLTEAEEATAYPLVTMPPDVGGLGFTFKWNMGFMHDTLDFMRSDPYFRHGAHEKMTFSMFYAFSENFILPYSHDEVVHGKKSLINKMHGDYDAKFAALKTLYAWQYGHPGKKLLFMGSEFAQFIEWDYKKELDWFLLEYDSHAGVQAWVKKLNRLYRENSALYAMDDGWEGFSWLTVDDRKNSVFAFMRSNGDEHVICVYNFSVQDFPGYEIALPEDGRLKLLLSSVGDVPAGVSGAAVAAGAAGAAVAAGAVVASGVKDAPAGVAGSAAADGVKDAPALRKKELNGMSWSAVFDLPKTSALFYEYIVS